VLAGVAGCRDEGPAKPTSIAIVSGAGQVGGAGQQLAVAPSFAVRDGRGRPMAGIPVDIRVTAGGGSLGNAPIVTSADPSTPVGDWILGTQLGVNELTIIVPGVEPTKLRVTAGPGAPARLIAVSDVAVTGRVGDEVAPLSARLTDAFGNPIPLSIVRVALSGGGLAPEVVFSDANGGVTISGWTLTTVVGRNVLTISAGQASLSFTADVRPGSPDRLEVVSGVGQSGRAGASIETPIVFRAVDKYGNATTSEPLQFTVTSGNGTLAASTAAPAADGLTTLPAWTLGRTALPQTVHVTSGSIGTDVTVAVQTDFNIDVRFYGPEMTDAQKALFTNAAARLSAVITGDVQDMPAARIDMLEFCGIGGIPVYTEPLDDVVIFAAIAPVDGPGKVLARAGPCAFRNSANGGFAAFGIMEFDVDDVAAMTSLGTLQDVITHEMLHVLGIGTAWISRGLLTGARTSASTYIGGQGRQGCLDIGGGTMCGTGVPVENNGVIGTTDSHWRERTFQTELMTGFSSPDGMPLSAITVGALGDLGFTVNPLAADPYRLPLSSVLSTMEQTPVEWEVGLPKKAGTLP
jgi:hypothetical protein